MILYYYCDLFSGLLRIDRMSSNIMWVEKYRPMKLSEVVNQKDIIGSIEALLKNPAEMPHLLFSGSAGVCFQTQASNSIQTENREDLNQGSAVVLNYSFTLKSKWHFFLALLSLLNTKLFSNDSIIDTFTHCSLLKTICQCSVFIFQNC